MNVKQRITTIALAAAFGYAIIATLVIFAGGPRSMAATATLAGLFTAGYLWVVSGVHRRSQD